MKIVKSGLPVACLKTESRVFQIKIWHVIFSVCELTVLLHR